MSFQEKELENIVKEQYIIVNKYKSIFEIEVDQATQMADLTKGYPFAFQVLGYLTWNHHGDYNAVRGEYEQYLSEFVYDQNLVGTVTERSYGCTWNCRCRRWKNKGYSGTFTHGNK